MNMQKIMPAHVLELYTFTSLVLAFFSSLNRIPPHGLFLVRFLKKDVFFNELPVFLRHLEAPGTDCNRPS